VTDNDFTSKTETHTDPQAEPTLRRDLVLPKGVLQKNLKTFVYLGAALLVIVAALFSSSGKKTPAQQAGAKGQPPQPALQDNTDSNVQELKNQLQAELRGGLGGRRPRRWPPGRPTARPALPCPVFRAAPARNYSRATCKCRSLPYSSRRS
jgi:hypothetical protein